MYTSNEVFKDILDSVRLIVMDVSDFEEVLCLVRDLFYAEADAIREKEPNAWRSIENCETIGREISINITELLDKYEEVYPDER